MAPFLTDETGAVTVDWTVLTAALVGLGLAVVSTVRSGVQNTSTDIASTLTGVTIFTAFDSVGAILDFSDGAGDWLGGDVRNIPGFGDVLALSGDNTIAELPIDIGDEHAFAVIEFDMIMGDSWDGEEAVITLNGQDVLVGTNNFTTGTNSVVSLADGTSVSLTNSTQNTGNPGWGNELDHSYRVQIVAANDGNGLSLGARTTLNQSADDEFLALDNVQVSGRNQQP